MLMKNNHRAFPRILWIIHVPIMPSIPGHYGHIIIIINSNDIEVFRIKALQIFCIKQPQPPSLQTMQPTPAPRTRSIASTSKIKSRLTAALVINSFESRPADLVTTVTDHPERTGRYHPYVSESLLRDIRSNHTVLGCLPLLFPQCCR